MNNTNKRQHFKKRQIKSKPDSRCDWLYGRRSVLEALRSAKRRFVELRVTAAVLGDADTDPELCEIRDLAASYDIRPQAVERDKLDELLGPVNHQGTALKASAFPYCGLADILAAIRKDDNATLLILDHIEDPQNLGSLLRTAEAVGAAGVIIPEDRAASVTPAAVRASAGAAEHLMIAKVVNIARSIEEIKKQECWVTCLDFGDDARNYTKIDFSGRSALVIGNEGKGVSRLVRDKCDFVAQLPMLGQVASLNASVAGGIVMYEIVRQRERI